MTRWFCCACLALATLLSGCGGGEEGAIGSGADAPQPVMAAGVVATGATTTPVVLPATLAMAAVSGASAQAQLSISLPAGATQLAIAVASRPAAPWLQAQLQGVTGATVTASSAGLAAGAYRAAVQVSFVAGRKSKRISVPVNFTVTVPSAVSITSVMPYGIPPGAASRVVIHGKGFAALASQPGAVTVSGATVTEVTVVTDSEMTAMVSAPTGGTYTLQAGLATGKLAVAAADPYVASSIATTGEKRNFVHDPVRQAVYATGRVENTLYKFQYASGKWAATVLPVANPWGLALSPDGSRLLVLTGAGEIKDVDPDTLQLRASYAGIPTNYGFHPAAITGDGRLWLRDSTKYFDLATNTVVQLENLPAFIWGFDYIGSADGSRMLISATYTMTPLDNWWLYKSADGSITNPMGGTQFWYDPRLSTDGKRLLMQQSGELYDQAYNLLGQLPTAGSTEYWRSSALTSDGRKIVVGVADASTGHLKRLDIYDTALGWVDGTINFVLSGSVAVESPPSNCYPSWPYDCEGTGYVFLSLDDRTIFVGGNQALQAYKMP